MNANGILLTLLVAVIVTMLALIYKNLHDKSRNNKKALNNLQKLVNKVNAPSDTPHIHKLNANQAPAVTIEGFRDASVLAPSLEEENNSTMGPVASMNSTMGPVASNNSTMGPVASMNSTMGPVASNNSIVPGPSVETFENHPGNNNKSKTEKLEEENEKLKKYLKIHGLYPENHAIDMSKYVLKSAVKPEKVCPDMSQYVLKTSIPPPVRCPQINRDDYIRKSELPANWNKQCPEHPDLTNYVLKSTIPPTQECPSCVCPKVKVNAGLCREPNKEDCMKIKDILVDVCPKPEPCPDPDPKEWIKRSELPPNWNKECPPKEECPPCPRPPPPPKCPEPHCPVCPEPPEVGKCPEPERCPPAQNCPKCYDVKYIKVPVVKSEPLPKPNKETIFPTNLIETKLVRQPVPEKPRQPRILGVEGLNNRNNEIINTPIEENFLAPSDVALNTSSVNMAPDMSNQRNNRNNKNNNIFNKAANAIKEAVNNRVRPKEVQGTCNSANVDRIFKKFGKTGFNNQN